MTDRLEDLPPAEPFIRLAQLGAEKWNRWVRTVVPDSEVPRLRLENSVAPLNDDERRSLSAELNLDNLPTITTANVRERREARGAVFSGVRFGMITPVRSFEGFAFPAGTDFSDAIFDGPARFINATFGDHCSFTNVNCKRAAQFKNVRFGHHLSFARARFDSWARFEQTTFGDDTSFESVNFENRATFSGAAFRGSAVFTGTSFSKAARFTAAQFGDDPSFAKTNFAGYTHFEGSTFGAGSDFEDIKFAKFVRFDGALFGEGATFTRSQFDGSARFDGATFLGTVRFSKCYFKRVAIFDAWVGQNGRKILEWAGQTLFADDTQMRAWISERVTVSGAETLQGASFSGAIFDGIVSFRARRFSGPISMRGAHFQHAPEFADVAGAGNLELTGAVIRIGHRFAWTKDGEVAARIRRFRKIAAEIYAHDIERDLFILERKAERGILWSLGGLRYRAEAIGWTLLLFLYGLSSGYGRSLLRPILWFGATWLAFQMLYRHLMGSSRPVWDADLASFTFGNMLPFAIGLNPARKDVLSRLFSHLDPFFGWTIKIPIEIELASIAQSIVGTTFLFLLLLAIRNRFKIG